jgi:hypothetical protein
VTQPRRHCSPARARPPPRRSRIGPSRRRWRRAPLPAPRYLQVPILVLGGLMPGTCCVWVRVDGYARLYSLLTGALQAPLSAGLLSTAAWLGTANDYFPRPVSRRLFLASIAGSLAHVLLWVGILAHAAAARTLRRLLLSMVDVVRAPPEGEGFLHERKGVLLRRAQGQAGPRDGRAPGAGDGATRWRGPPGARQGRCRPGRLERPGGGRVRTRARSRWPQRRRGGDGGGARRRLGTQRARPDAAL